MSCLYIDKKGLILKNQKDALIIYKDDIRQATIPMRLLERIVIASQVQLNASLLGKLGSLGIGIIVLSGYQKDITLLLPAKSDAQRRTQQYRNVENHALPLSKILMISKLIGQNNCLKHFNCGLDSHLQNAIAQITQSNDLSQLLGIEGYFAKLYFAQLQTILPSQWQFTGRRKRPAPDPINALLSLSYTLLYAEATRAIVSFGLDPAMGFYHQPLPQRMSLSCDIIEPLRSDIDLWLINEILQETWQPTDFHITSPNTACTLNKTARSLYYQRYETQYPNITQKLKQTLNQLCTNWTIDLPPSPENWTEWEAICSK